MSQQTRDDINRIYRLVKKNFAYRKDRGLENWQMPPSTYNGKQLLVDDCDGFCLACRTLLRRAGIPSRLVYCEIQQQNRWFGHLVVEVDGWIMDLMQPNVVSNRTLVDYRWHRISGYQPGDPWREIVGMQV